MWHDSITPGGDAAALAAASEEVATENAAAEDTTSASSTIMLKLVDVGQPREFRNDCLLEGLKQDDESPARIRTIPT